MTSRRRGVALTPMETRRDVIVRTAVLADELGYEIFAVPEGWFCEVTGVPADRPTGLGRGLTVGVRPAWALGLRSPSGRIQRPVRCGEQHVRVHREQMVAFGACA